MARRLGVPDEKLAATTAPSSPPLSPAECAAVAFAIESTKRPEGVCQPTFDALREHWSEVQIVEIAAVVGVFNFTNRFANSLGIERTVYPSL